jgi:His-Xaa-Ser system protein HxsD
MENLVTGGFMEYYTIKDGFSVLTLNPRLYNLDTIYSALYQLIDDAYVVLDGDPDIEIEVRLSWKDDKKNDEKQLGELAKEFLNQLVNYTYYKINTKKREFLRALMLKKSFGDIVLEDVGSDESEVSQKSSEPDSSESAECAPEQPAEQETVSTDLSPEDLDDEDLVFEDPEGIAIPWEEKYANNDEDSTEKNGD